MKFSVLLPTHNRLELLKIAIHSVLKQDFQDWEVIVSDNFSQEDIAGYIQSLNDSRIKYFRTEKFVPVTENWNNAMEKSTGDYVIMIGDDDCLMKGYFTTINQLLEEYPDPDFIYTSGFMYAYPGVMPWSPSGFLSAFGNASFLESKQEPFWLERTAALKLVHDVLNFKVMFAFNVQYSVLSRHFINKMLTKGKFYQTSYPDYYTMTAMFLEGQRILACPLPLIMVGISPKSFGFFHFNQLENDAADFLQLTPEHLEHPHLQKLLLPGTQMNTFWLFSMETVKNNYQNEYALEPNYQRYRWLQMIKIYKQWIVNKKRDDTKIKMLWSRMTWREKATMGLPLHLIALLLLFIPLFLRKKMANRLELLGKSHPAFKSLRVEGNYTSALQVFEEIESAHYKPI